jgi:hypothetical protein
MVSRSKLILTEGRVANNPAWTVLDKPAMAFFETGAKIYLWYLLPSARREPLGTRCFFYEVAVVMRSAIILPNVPRSPKATFASLKRMSRTPSLLGRPWVPNISLAGHRLRVEARSRGFVKVGVAFTCCKCFAAVQLNRTIISDIGVDVLAFRRGQTKESLPWPRSGILGRAAGQLHLAWPALSTQI